jgi:hypothetical protein
MADPFVALSVLEQYWCLDTIDNIVTLVTQIH